MASITTQHFRLPSMRDWKSAVFLLLSYLAVASLVTTVVPPSVPLFPSAAVALAGLFFGGVRLWPVVLIASLLMGTALSYELPLLLALSLGQTVQAATGARLLKNVRFDPLFRRYRDTFYFFAVAALISLILPVCVVLAGLLAGMPLPAEVWGQTYVAMLASLLIVTPFVFRWLAKPRFSRSLFEVLETTVVFLMLCAIDAAIFIYGIESVAGLPLVYVLTVPLFWIALRLRPRFLSLALLITALFAVGGTLLTTPPDMLIAQLYEVEAFLIFLSIAFFTIVSLEEDRRVNTNIMRAQVSTLENAVARISSESNAKNDFIAILAHELRNPLAPIMSAIDLLKLRGLRDEEERKTVGIMEERMTTIRRLLDDLLDISRITEGKLALKQQTLDLESVIRRAVLSTEHYVRERHQTLELKFPNKHKYVKGDPVRLEQIFSNLLTNASRYSPSGSKIILRMHRVEEHVEVSIEDKGAGIEQAELKTIFIPFHQLEHGTRNRKGLGIGLALVHGFVEMHGGTITAKSEGKNKGSTFTVRLPLLPDPGPQSQKKKTKKYAVAPHSAGLSVLVVDDNDAAAAGIGRLLELRGCTVSYAYTGGDAIEKVEEIEPDVVLLDVGLPDQDGYMVASTLRARSYTGTLIALTGYSTSEAREKGKNAGFDHYLIKPAGLADLMEVIPQLG